MTTISIYVIITI